MIKVALVVTRNPRENWPAIRGFRLAMYDASSSYSMCKSELVLLHMRNNRVLYLYSLFDFDQHLPNVFSFE